MISSMRAMRYLGMGLMLFCIAFAHAELTLEVTGLADPSMTSARELAIDDALRNAVQEGIGVYLESETIVENYQLVEDRILTQVRGFARLIEVTSEEVRDDELLHLRAVVAVSEGKLEDNLKRIIQANGDPRIMIAVQEDVPNASVAPFAVTSMRSELLRLGYSLVETRNTMPDFSDVAEVSRQALSMGADIVLLLDIQATENENAPQVLRNAGFESVFTNISVNLVEMRSSRVLFSQTFSPITGTVASTADAAVRQAIQGLVPEIQDGLASELTLWLQGLGQADALYYLTIENMSSYSQIAAFLDGLSENEGVSRVDMRNFLSGTAEVELEYQGRREGLLALLENQQMVITAVQNRSINLEVP